MHLSSENKPDDVKICLLPFIILNRGPKSSLHEADGEKRGQKKKKNQTGAADGVAQRRDAFDIQRQTESV